MIQTENINLPILQEGDKYSKDIQNQAFRDIDREIKGLNDRVKILDNVEGSIIETKEDVEDLKVNKADTITTNNKFEQTNQQINKINEQLETMASYVTPLMFGAKGDYNENSNTGTDDNIALQRCLESNGDNKCVIDLMGKTYYTSLPLKISRQQKKITNGTIVSEGNVFVRGNKWTAGLTFDDVKIVSLNGYSMYCDNTFGGAGLYKSLFIDCKFVGKLGGFKVENDVQSFSNTFIRCTVESSNGNGFDGVKGVATSFIGCDHSGIPNGSLFHNCHDCIIISSDSNGILKHAITYDIYGIGSTFKKCNFEGCTHEAVITSTQIKELIFEECSFHHRAYEGVNYTVEYPFILTLQGILSLKNCSISGFTDKLADIKFKTGAGMKLKTENTSITFFQESTSKLFDFPLNGIYENPNSKNVFDNQNILENNKGTNKILNIGEYAIGSFFYNDINITSKTQLQADLYISLGKTLSNSFIISGVDVKTLYGIIPFKSYPISMGNIVTITNKTGSNITLYNNYGTNNSFVLKADANSQLANNNSISFIAKLIDGNLKWVEF